MSTPTYEFRFQRGSSNRWTEVNPILGAGEPGVEIDTGLFKIGDGHTAWEDLEYFLTDGYVSGLIEVMLAEEPNDPFYLPFGKTGNLTVFTGPKVYFPDTVNFLGATITLTTAPTGSSAIFRVLKNGSNVYSIDPTIAVTEFLASTGTLTDPTTFNARTDYLQVQCTQVGSTISGADLAVALKLRSVL
jgi:hypothetical protein